jgi:hypothetical protein
LYGPRRKGASRGAGDNGTAARKDGEMGHGRVHARRRGRVDDGGGDTAHANVRLQQAQGALARRRKQRVVRRHRPHRRRPHTITHRQRRCCPVCPARPIVSASAV